MLIKVILAVLAAYHWGLSESMSLGRRD